MAYQQMHRSVVLAAHHNATGFTKHYRGSEILPPPHELQIVRYSDEEGYYLLYLDRHGMWQTDTLHNSVEAAMEQARLEFSVDPQEWEVYNPPKRKLHPAVPRRDQQAAQRIRQQLSAKATAPDR